MRPLFMALCLLGSGLLPAIVAAVQLPGAPAGTNAPGTPYPRLFR
jgi:hypothetical protein